MVLMREDDMMVITEEDWMSQDDGDASSCLQVL